MNEEHINLGTQLLKELSVKYWLEEGPIMLDGVPTKEQIRNICTLIQAKYGKKPEFKGIEEEVEEKPKKASTFGRR